MGAVGVYLDPAGVGVVVTSRPYFYCQVIIPFVLAALRVGIILRITYDRELYVARHPGATRQDLSHTRYWWCNPVGLTLSSVFVFGDGTGRIWAVVSAIDVMFLVLNLPSEPLSLLWYFSLSLAIALTSGVIRLAWWIWYWYTFSEVRDRPRGASAPPMPEDPTLYHRLRALLRRIYPTVAYAIPSWLHRGVRNVYHFLDGFGRTFAFFSVINFVVDYYDDDIDALMMLPAYYWVSLVLSICGGLFTTFGPGTPRYKVFLHEENIVVKTKGPEYAYYGS